MERTIEFSPAFDKRDPNPNKNYGIHGVDIRFLLKGKDGAVQFLIYTNWQLPHVQKETDAKALNEIPYMFHKPMAADLGYHSRVPRYGSQSCMGTCEYLDGADCYYDGSGLNARRVFKIMLEGGSDAVWKELESFYKEIFDN